MPSFSIRDWSSEPGSQTVSVGRIIARGSEMGAARMVGHAGGARPHSKRATLGRRQAPMKAAVARGRRRFATSGWTARRSWS